jgi:hypothetical protein
MNKPAVNTMTLADLREESKIYHSLKCWFPRQIDVDREIANRVTAAWRNNDIYGNTFNFTPEDYDPKSS